MVDRRRARYLAGLVGALLVLVAVGVGTARAADTAVAISGSAFSPPTVTVTVGDTVTWTNGDQISHTATADGGSFDTGTLANGDSNTVTFATAGSFPYHCAIHPAMTGTITVEAAAPAPASAAPTNPPTDTTPGTASNAAPGIVLTALLVGGGALVGLFAARRRFVRG